LDFRSKPVVTNGDNPVNKVLGALFILLVLQASAHATDKIRIGFPDLAAPFLSFPLAQKKGFFHEEGLQAEFVRINPTVALAALVKGELDYYTVIPPLVGAAIQRSSGEGRCLLRT